MSLWVDGGVKRVLFISLTQVYPVVSGGQIRTSSIISELLRRGWQVKLVCLTGRKKDYFSLMGSTSEIIEKNLEQYVDRSCINGILQWICYKLRIPDIWLFGFPREALLSREIKRGMQDYSTKIFDAPYSTRIIDPVDFSYKVLVSHNSEKERWSHFSHRWKRFPIIGQCLGKWKGGMASLIEKKAAGLVDSALVCSSEEKEVYAKYQCKNIFVIPNIPLENYQSDLDILALRSELGYTPEDLVLLFPASKYFPNWEAYKFLHAFVGDHQAILAKYNINILVAGSVTEKVHALGRLRVMGPVGNMVKYFSLSDAMLNPVLYGSGTCLKVAQAIKAGLPVISTAFGVRGFVVRPGSDALLFNRRDLLNCLILFSRLSKQSRSKMASHCSRSNSHLLDLKKSMKIAVADGLNL